MIKFKDILEENLVDGSTETQINLHDSQILGIVKDFCGYSRLPKPVMFRGIDSASNAFIYNPKNIERRSANTSNYYTLLIDNSPYWKKYPKRSRSLICSTSKETASNYGSKLFVVLPFKDAKIGVCEDSDIFTSFMFLHKFDMETMGDFNDALEEMNADDLNFIALKNSIKNNPILKSNFGIQEEGGLSNLIEDFKQSGQTNFLDYLFEIMKPEENDFQMTSFYNLDNGDFYNREVWTDSKCLLVEYELYFDIMRTNSEAGN